MWHEKIYHFWPHKAPSSAGYEIHTEFFVAISDLPAAMHALYEIAELFRDYVQITELRAVKADNTPLSPANGRDVMGIHWTWKHDFENVMKAVEPIKVALEPFNYTVHWGKYFGHLDHDYTRKIYGDDFDGLNSLIQSYSNSENWSNKFQNCFTWRMLQ